MNTRTPEAEPRIGKISASVSTFVIFLLGMLTVSVFSYILGQDANWDLRNYHFYSGYSFWHGAFDKHVIPAQQQTFLNPLLSVHTYLLIAYVPPWTAGIIFGLVQGLNVGLVYWLARRVFTDCMWPSSLNRRVLVWMSVAVGVTAPLFVSEIGASYGDNVTSILVLLSLIFVGKHLHDRWNGWAVGAGIAAGAAAGLKLTNLIFVLGLFGCGWWVSRNWRQAAYRVSLFGLGALAGLLVCHGYWSWYLWKEFENPVFPFYNALFRSPYFDAINVADRRFLPNSVLDALSYPFQWAAGLHPSAELAFRDVRFAAITVLLIIAIPMLGLRFRAVRRDFPRFALILTVFFIGSYSIWLFMFGIHRYIIPLELLSGIVSFVLVEQLIRSRTSQILIILVVALVAIVMTRPPNWGRLPWAADWFGVTLPTSLQVPNQLFVMLGSDPTSYVIPFLPEGSRVVRIEGNLQPSAGTGLARLQREAIATHKGPIRSLGTERPAVNRSGLLDNYGVRLGDNGCAWIRTRVDDLMSCPLKRVQFGH